MEIPGIRPELIAVGAVLYGRELWQAQEEICKIETGVGARERKTSSRVIISSGIRLNAAELYSPAHRMFGARPDHRVAELQRLVNPPGSVQIAYAAANWNMADLFTETRHLSGAGSRWRRHVGDLVFVKQPFHIPN